MNEIDIEVKTVDSIITKWKSWYMRHVEKDIHITLKKQFFNLAIRCCLYEISKLPK